MKCIFHDANDISHICWYVQSSLKAFHSSFPSDHMNALIMSASTLGKQLRESIASIESIKESNSFSISILTCGYAKRIGKANTKSSYFDEIF